MERESAGGWIVVAEGDQGYERWAPGYEAMRDVAVIIAAHEDWNGVVDPHDLFGGIDYFEPLATSIGERMPPELYEELDGFWLEISDPEADEIPGQSFNHVILRLDEDVAQDVKRRFEHLLEKIRSDPAANRALSELGLI